MSKRSEKLFFFALIAFLGVLYMWFANLRYFVDGLNTAWLIETSDAWIIHPNHPLFPLIPQMLFLLAGGESEAVTGLGFLLVWTTIFGMISCWGIRLLAREAGASITGEAFAILLFGFSSAIWYFFSTANQYSTALAAYIFALYAIIRIARNSSPISLRRSILLGLFTGIAILIHQVNIFLSVPLGWAIFRRDGAPREKSIKFLAVFLAALIIAAGFTIFCAVFIVGVESVPEFIEWQKSYVTQTRYWAHGLLDSVARTARGAFDLHLAHTFHSEGLFGDWQDAPSEPGVILFRAAQAFVILFIVVETVRGLVEYFRDKNRSTIQTIGLYAAVPFVVFSLIFTPESTNYRIFYLPGWLMFMAPVFERHFRFQTPRFRNLWLPALVIITLFTANFAVKFYPESIPTKNPYITEAGLLSIRVGPGDLVIYSGAEEDYLRAQYLRYFSRADILILPELIEAIRREPGKVIADFIERDSSGNLIMVHEDALYSEEDVEWINDFYRTDIAPNELENFIDDHTELVSGMVINEKQYLLIEPLE